MLAALATLMSAGCASAPPTGKLTYWAAEDGFEGTTATDGSEAAFDPTANQVTLVAALNETVAFRVWVTYAGYPEAIVTADLDEWQAGEARMAADAATIYRVESVHVPRWRGWQIRTLAPHERNADVEDVLIPAAAPQGGLPCRMADGTILSLWIDLHVPKGTRPGTWSSTLHLRGNPGPAVAIALRLEVLPFLLPDTTGVVLAAEVDSAALFARHVTYQGSPTRATRVALDSPIRAELQSVLDATLRLLQAHRVTPLLTTLYPVIKIDALNAVSLDWTAYDAAVAGYLDGSKFTDRTPLPLWVVPFDERFPMPPSYGALQSPAYSRHLREYLAQCAEHFAAAGWLERSVVRIPQAEFPSPAAWQAAEHFAGIIRKADPRWRILCNLFPQDLGPYGWPDFPTADLLGYVDIWCPPAQFYARPPSIGGVAPADMWMRVDRPPFSGTLELGAPAADTWVLPWQAQREAAPVIHAGLINAWPDDPAPTTAQSVVDAAWDRGDRRTPLLYPGSIVGLTEPIPSVRLKRLQRGLQDAAYLKLMRDKGIGHIAEVLAESLAPFAGARAYRYHYADARTGGWVREPQRWRDARQIMVDELRAVLEEGPGGPRARVAADARWRRFMDVVRRIEVAVEGVRVRREGGVTAGNTTVECAVVLRNGTRTPVSGVLGFGELPVGWVSRSGAARVFLAPGGSSHLILAADAPVVTWDEAGVRYLPIVFRTEDGRTQEIAARLSMIAAQPLDHPLRIDGDLSDWPMGVANLAADFVLISGEPPDGTRPATSRPTHATRVYAVADAEAVYLAFDCATEALTPVLPSHTSVLEYDDLIPLGQELVEIVLDPSGAGTHSTSDLYHVAIQPAGTLWERGVGTDPPTGKHGVWAAGIQHAARATPNRWVAEVRIPRAACGADASGQIWGVNFSRVDGTRQEYSSWSGATGNIYDPASLGNLALP